MATFEISGTGPIVLPVPHTAELDVQDGYLVFRLAGMHKGILTDFEIHMRKHMARELAQRILSE